MRKKSHCNSAITAIAVHCSNAPLQLQSLQQQHSLMLLQLMQSLQEQIMSNKLSFGKYEGKTMEWLFFNAPWYAQYIWVNSIHFQPERMTEQESEYFSQLYRRACGLTSKCRDCNERPISRLGLTWQRNGNLGLVGLYCSECEYMGGSATAYHPASFFIEAHTLANCDQLRITKEIRRQYITGNLTQAKMKAFFSNDSHFSHCRPGFFAGQVVK